jgi:hypothetical protein
VDAVALDAGLFGELRGDRRLELAGPGAGTIGRLGDEAGLNETSPATVSSVPPGFPVVVGPQMSPHRSQVPLTVPTVDALLFTPPKVFPQTAASG